MTSQSEIVLPTALRLSGHGVRLRPWTGGDVAAMTELFDDPQIARWTPLRSPFDLRAARLYLANALRRSASGSRVQLAITTDGERPLGEVLLMPGEGGGRELELGYMVGPAHRGQGLAARALTVLTDYAHRELSPARLVLRIEPGNAASNAVARTAGYLRTDEEPLLREGSDGRRTTLLTWEHQPPR